MQPGYENGKKSIGVGYFLRRQTRIRRKNTEGALFWNKGPLGEHDFLRI